MISATARVSATVISAARAGSAARTARDSAMTGAARAARTITAAGSEAPRGIDALTAAPPAARRRRAFAGLLGGALVETRARGQPRRTRAHSSVGRAADS